MIPCIHSAHAHVLSIYLSLSLFLSLPPSLLLLCTYPLHHLPKKHFPCANVKAAQKHNFPNKRVIYAEMKGWVQLDHKTSTTTPLAHSHQKVNGNGVTQADMERLFPKTACHTGQLQQLFLTPLPAHLQGAMHPSGVPSVDAADVRVRPYP